MIHFGASVALVRRRYEVLAVACFLASGFLSLAYEICWIRKASLVFGSASFALSTVLAVFFGGLAAGSYWFGRGAASHVRPLRRYAVIELAVGVAALTSPAAFAMADRVFCWLYPLVYDSFALLLCVRFILLVLLLFPAAFLMGGTLPLFCRQFVRSEASIIRSVGLLYGLNTAGALLGCSATGFWLIPWFGVNMTLWWGGAVNLLLALVAWLLPLRGPTVSELSAKTAAENLDQQMPSLRRRSAVLSGVFFLVGFTALGYEVLWARFLSLLIYNTMHTYTLTVTVVLAGIVLGSLFAAFALARLQRPSLVLGIVQISAGVVVAGTMFLPAAFWEPWRDVDSVAWQLGLVALVMLPAAVLAGIAFPVASRLATRQANTTAADIGRLVAINTWGGILGSLAVGFALLPLLGLHLTALTTTAICVVNGLMAWWMLDGSLSRPHKIGLSALGVGVWLLVATVSPTRVPADFLAPRDLLVEYREGHSANVAVVRDGPRLRLEVDRLWQGENIKTHQIVAAHLPMLLHEDPRRVLVIGLGPGQTASRFLMYPIEQMDCVEIEAEMLPLVRKHFHGQWLDNARLRCIVEDGRNYVAHTDQRYDLISVEVGQAFRPGVASFYTAEFYEQARRRLRPGGLVTQFVSLKFFDPDELRTVIRTFLEVFPESLLCHNRAELILVGKRDGQLRLTGERLAVLQSNSAVREDLEFRYWGGRDRLLQIPEVFAANLLLGPEQLEQISREARVYHDDRPILEYSSSSYKTESVAAATSLLQQHLSPLSELTAGSLATDAAQLRRSELIRDRNLENLLAEDLVVEAQEALAAESTERAEDLLRSALELNPENLRANLLMADTLVSLQEVKEAIRYYQTLLGMDETNPLLHERLSAAWQAQGNTWEARRHSQRVEQLQSGRF